tara:strand:- start:60 stop:413 length:354 start_codon:yes stop_codon:yes gene_type:complete
MNWDTNNFILKRFKIKIYDTVESFAKSEVGSKKRFHQPADWQLLISEGQNIVWNNLNHNQRYGVGDILWVKTGWVKTPVYREVDPLNPDSGIEHRFEPRMWIDNDQRDSTNYTNIQL